MQRVHREPHDSADLLTTLVRNHEKMAELECLKGKIVTTKLEKPLKRQIDIKGQPYIVTITPEGMKLTQKGKRKGHELAWADLASGQAALAVALNASLEEAST
jgi:hypothetical protein